MIYFIGKEFEKLDEEEFSVSDYVSAEIGMDQDTLTISLAELKDELKTCEKYKFNIVVTSNINKEDQKQLSDICKEQKIYYLNINFTKFDIQDVSYLIIDKIEENRVLSYSELSKVYDFLQDRMMYNIYDDLFAKYINRGKFLELGAGSGIVTQKLREYDLNILASDLNPNFLKVLENKGLGVKTKCIDICKIDEYKLDTDFDYVGMFLDTLNYINPIYLDYVFSNIYNLLNPGGIFIFDIHKLEKIKEFDNYIEEVKFDQFKFHWLSKKESNYVVSHNFMFINDKLSFEKHIQYILPLKDYQDQYLQYFKEVEIKHIDRRMIIVLQKLK